MTLGQKQEYFSKMLAKFITWLYDNSCTVRMGEVWRPQEMQDLYLKTGKTRAKYSKHQDKVAADLYIFKDGKLLQTKEELKFAAEYWKSLDADNRWGGEFQNLFDAPHWEYNG